MLDPYQEKEIFFYIKLSGLCHYYCPSFFVKLFILVNIYILLSKDSGDWYGSYQTNLFPSAAEVKDCIDYPEDGIRICS